MTMREDPGSQLYPPSNGSVAQAVIVKNPYAVIERLTQALSPHHSLAALLHSLAALVQEVLGIDLCLVMLVDEANSILSTQATSPDLSNYELHFTPFESGHVPWQKLRVFNTEGQLPALTVQEQEQLNPLKQVQYEMLRAIPLSIGDQNLGLLLCYASKNRDYGREELVLLRSIISQASLAIQNRQLARTPTSRNLLKAFFDDLLSPEAGKEESLRGRAIALGCDLAQPHVMLMIAMGYLSWSAVTGFHNHNHKASQVPVSKRQTGKQSSKCGGGGGCRVGELAPPDEEESPAEAEHIVNNYAARLIKHQVQEHSPGSLVDERENLLYCLLPLNSSGDVLTWLPALIQQVQVEQRIQMFAGIGNPYADVYDYKKGFAEAEAALRIGPCLTPGSNITHFNELGVYRYIYEFACSNTLDDIYLEKIAAITSYDQQRKRSELLDTLEIFLETGCNIKDTSERLHLHRNTIIQRLKRIQDLSAISLDHPQQRLWLQVSLMVHKLRKHHASLCLRSDKTIST